MDDNNKTGNLLENGNQVPGTNETQPSKHRNTDMVSETIKDPDSEPNLALSPDISRRDLLKAVPKVAAGITLASESTDAWAFYNAMFMKRKPTTGTPPTIYGLWAFGRNYYGQLGIEDQNDRSIPVLVGTLSSWSKLGGDSGITLPCARTELFGLLGLIITASWVLGTTFGAVAQSR